MSPRLWGVRLGRRQAAGLLAVVFVCGLSEAPASAQAAAATTSRAVAITTAPVPINPANPWQTRLGDFVYAGGLVLTAPETDQLHGLSDLVVTGTNRLTAVSDTGLLFEARLQLDAAGRLTGLAEGRLAPLVGLDGALPRQKEDMDAEGLALFPNGDRLISFEVRDRVWLYPANGGVPRAVPSPAMTFPVNTGLEALTVAADVAADAYIVGDEEHGNTWTCRISAGCTKGSPVDLPPGYVLVSMRRLGAGQTAYLLRAFDLRRGNRNSLRIYRDGVLAGQLDLALPLTIDNYEGVAAVSRADGSIRFYLVSDDNARSFQRTLLSAFDWTPPAR